MEHKTLGAALEAEHRDIDGGIEAYLAQPADGVGTTGTLQRSLAGLRRHIYLEEEFLFPPLKTAGLMGPIFVMEREHGTLWNIMDRLDELITEQDAAAARDTCIRLLGLLEKHNAIEEKVIYGQADELLNSSEGTALSGFMESGSMPTGWVARSAGK